MDITRLDELVLAVMDSPRQERLTALKEFVSAIGKPVPEEVADCLEPSGKSGVPELWLSLLPALQWTLR